MEHTTIRKPIQNLVLSAMLLAVGIVLPFFTGQIPKVGSMLLPMHLPVLVCGLVCGWQYRWIYSAIVSICAVWDAAYAKRPCNGV